MKVSEYTAMIADELKETLTRVPDNQTEQLIEAISHAQRIYVAGAGRSLLMIRSLAMRLMQTGFIAYVVGETTTPAITSQDLLIIASGSGETGTLKVMASKAKEIGASLALITIYPESTLGKLADCIIEVPAPTSKAESSYQSIQPGASLFEQSVLLIGDSIILRIGAVKAIQNPNLELMKLHANLE